MASMTYGFIFVAPGLNGEETIIERDDFRSILVGVSSPADGPAAAVKLVKDGVQLLDLCGAFGPVATAKVIEAIDGRIPVGHSNYGFESIGAVSKMFNLQG
ncbi:MAG: hypothetical protein IIZ13_04745 [Renibacterium sp.]|nr:hypothetical protein [Renibacterium sp.]